MQRIANENVTKTDNLKTAKKTGNLKADLLDFNRLGVFEIAPSASMLR